MKFVFAWLLLLTAIVAQTVAEKSMTQKRIWDIGVTKSSEPCLNFYEYACSDWHLNDRTIRGKYGSVEDAANYYVNMELIKYMENVHMTEKPLSVQKAYQFYSSCVYLGKEWNGLKYLQWLQEHENITVALLSSSDEDQNFDWVHTMGVLRKYGSNGIFISASKLPNPNNPLEYVDVINRPTTLRLTQENINILKQSVKLPDNAEKSFDELFSEFKVFEDHLEKILNNEYYDKNEELTPDELSTSGILVKYLEIISDQRPLDRNKKIVLVEYDFMPSVVYLLMQYDAKFLCRYLEVQFLVGLTKYTTQESELDCMSSTRDLLPMSMDWIYMQLHPELEQEIPKINEIFNKTMEHAKKTLSSANEDVLPENFLEKLDKVQLKIGNLPRIDTTEVLESSYANLTLSTSDYYGNLLTILNFYFRTAYSMMENPSTVDINTFLELRDTHNEGKDIFPYYVPQINVLWVNYYLLRQPIYHFGYDDLFKYSSLAMHMLQPIFRELGQLSGFSDGQTNNTAAVGSFYSAFHTYFSGNSTDLEHNPSIDEKEMKQLFFLNAAQTYCQKNLTSYESQHVNFIASHIPEFTQLFECKLNSLQKLFK